MRAVMSDVDIAVEAARRGAAVLLKYWEQLGKEDAHTKARNDWVSAADRESERAIIDFLSAECPNDIFIGEESGFTTPSPGLRPPPPRDTGRGASAHSSPSPHSGGEGARRADEGRTWIIDPLDGTSNYLQHFPVWSISIGLRDGDEMIAGLIYEPLRDLFFTAERGAGAFRNGLKMRVSNQNGIEGSFLATGFPFRAQDHIA